MVIVIITAAKEEVSRRSDKVCMGILYEDGQIKCRTFIQEIAVCVLSEPKVNAELI